MVPRGELWKAGEICIQNAMAGLHECALNNVCVCISVPSPVSQSTCWTVCKCQGMLSLGASRPHRGKETSEMTFLHAISEHISLHCCCLGWLSTRTCTHKHAHTKKSLFSYVRCSLTSLYTHKHVIWHILCDISLIIERKLWRVYHTGLALTVVDLLLKSSNPTFKECSIFCRSRRITWIVLCVYV